MVDFASRVEGLFVVNADEFKLVSNWLINCDILSLYSIVQIRYEEKYWSHQRSIGFKRSLDYKINRTNKD